MIINKPVIKGKMDVKFPAKVEVQSPLTLEKENGTYRFGGDFADVAISGSYNDLKDKPNALPAGGTTGQVLAKNSDTEGDTEWVDQTGGNFIQAGTGAVTRTMQDKAREAVSLTDFGTATQATDAVTNATGGGTIVVPNGASAPTLPTGFPNVVFDYLGPDIDFSQYVETGPADSKATRLFKGQTAKSATDTPQKLLAIEYRPTGADVNGPGEGSYALGISAIKQNWLSGATQRGEIGGLNVVVRQGGQATGEGSDASGAILNIQNIGPTGFVVGIEGDVSNIDAAATMLLTGVHFHLAYIDARTGDVGGLNISPTAGVMDVGVQVQALDPATSVSKPFLYKTSAGDLFSVDIDGNIVGKDISVTGAGATSYTPTIAAQSTPGSFAYTLSHAYYKKFGKQVDVWVRLVVTTLSTAAGVLQISLPIASAFKAVGQAANLSLAKGALAVVGFTNNSNVDVCFDTAAFPATANGQEINVHVRYMTT